MLTKTEKLRYLELAEYHDTNNAHDNAEIAEFSVNEALKRIEDINLRLELDSLIGQLALEREYKGFEIGRQLDRRNDR